METVTLPTLQQFLLTKLIRHGDKKEFAKKCRISLSHFTNFLNRKRGVGRKIYKRIILAIDEHEQEYARSLPVASVDKTVTQQSLSVYLNQKIPRVLLESLLTIESGVTIKNIRDLMIIVERLPFAPSQETVRNIVTDFFSKVS